MYSIQLAIFCFFILLYLLYLYFQFILCTSIKLHLALLDIRISAYFPQLAEVHPQPSTQSLKWSNPAYHCSCVFLYPYWRLLYNWASSCRRLDLRDCGFIIQDVDYWISVPNSLWHHMCNFIKAHVCIARIKACVNVKTTPNTIPFWVHWIQVQCRGFQTFWSQDSLTLLKIIEFPRSLCLRRLYPQIFILVHSNGEKF